MVFNAKSYQIYHPLTESGKEKFQDILEKAGDEILYKHQHPIKYWTEKLIDFLREKISKYI